VPIVNRKEFAEVVGYSPRQVSDWMDQGMPCTRSGRKGEEVQIETAAAIQWLMKRDDSELASARLRRAQAERAERENLEAAGALIPVDEHTDFVCELSNQFVRSLAGLPGRLAGELAAITDPALMRARLQDEIGTIRNTLATRCGNAADRIVHARDAVAEVAADPELAVEDDAGPVG
jgi:phage terminase Nu1 subunit (DNA packaging protein)